LSPCPRCHTALEPGDLFCPHCGLRLEAAPDERLLVRRRLRVLHDRQHGRRALRVARGWILAPGILSAVAALVYGLGALIIADEVRALMALLLTVNLLLGAAYLGLWLWARRRAFPALLAAFFPYLVTKAAAIVVAPGSATIGLVFKALIVVGLAGGLQAAYHEQRQEERRG
jgi:hypothetical protein